MSAWAYLRDSCAGLRNFKFIFQGLFVSTLFSLLTLVAVALFLFPNSSASAGIHTAVDGDGFHKLNWFSERMKSRPTYADAAEPTMAAIGKNTSKIANADGRERIQNGVGSP